MLSCQIFIKNWRLLYLHIIEVHLVTSPLFSTSLLALSRILPPLCYHFLTLNNRNANYICLKIVDLLFHCGLEGTLLSNFKIHSKLTWITHFSEMRVSRTCFKIMTINLVIFLQNTLYKIVGGPFAQGFVDWTSASQLWKNVYRFILLFMSYLHGV